MEYGFAVLFVLGLLISGGVALAITIPAGRKHMETVREVRNHDWSMSHFVFRVRLSEEEIYRRLSEQSDADALFCDWDRTTGRVEISSFRGGYGGSRGYWLTLQPEGDTLLLRLDQISHLSQSSYIPIRINPFFIEKLGAEPVAYSAAEE